MSRKKKEPKYKSFKLSKRIKLHRAPIASPIKLFKNSWKLIRENKSLFIGIALVHTILSLIFVSGLGTAFDFVETKNEIEDSFASELGAATTTLTLFSYLVSSASTGAGEAAGTYQLFLTLITSLAVIWAIRQAMAGEKVGLRDAYYRGIYPLVPFILVLFVVGLQLLPAVIGSSLYSIVLSNQLAVTSLEKILWLILFLLALILSLYMIISSIFALYISTLPDMTPIKALRSARDLVITRRVGIGMRIVALPLILLVFAMIILIPIILLAPWLAAIIFVLFSSFALIITHAYIYNLYRSLL